MASYIYNVIRQAAAIVIINVDFIVQHDNMKGFLNGFKYWMEKKT